MTSLALVTSPQNPPVDSKRIQRNRVANDFSWIATGMTHRDSRFSEHAVPPHLARITLRTHGIPNLCLAHSQPPGRFTAHGRLVAFVISAIEMWRQMVNFNKPF